MAIIQLLGGDVTSMTYQWEERSGGMIALFTLASGGIASLHSSGGSAYSGPREHVEVVGQGKHIVVNNGIRLTYYRRTKGLFYGRAANYFIPEDEAPLHWEPEFSLGVLYNDNAFLLGYVPEIRAFCDSVLTGTTPERAGLRDTRMMMRVYEAFRQPAGQTISLAPETSAVPR